jgi:hypothetical protein
MMADYMENQAAILLELRQRLSEVEAENKRLMKSADGAAYEAWQIALADQERMREALQQILDCSISLRACAIARAALSTPRQP